MLILCVLCISMIQWWQGMKLQATCVLLLMCYTACNVICIYIGCVLLVSISQNFLSNSHVSVKFKLSCAVVFIVYTRKIIHIIYSLTKL